jgi:hypothetical protein
LARPRKSWRTNALFLIALWIVLLLLSLTILSSVVIPFLRTLQTQNIVSLDWGGYAVSSNILFPQSSVTGVNGSWVVPSVSASTSDSFSSAWLGIGGQTDTTLIQCGTEHDWRNSQATYYAWYELLPNNSIAIPEMTISPGDKITASVTLTNDSQNTWLIQITDLTTGESFSQEAQYNSTRRTAEWIVERPTVNDQLSELANFGTVTFTNMTATIAGETGTANDFPNYQILMEDRQNNQLITLSALTNDGASYTVNYTG